MTALADELDLVARDSAFSGVIRVVREELTEVSAAHGLAQRGERIPNRVDTRFGVASVTKGFTAVVVLSLIEDGVLHEHTTARSLLGDDLPVMDDHVTVEQLLGHRSGIGDYLDEESVDGVDAYVMPVPVHQLDSTEGYLPALEGRPTVAAPDVEFRYCNSGYVLLALLAERASGTAFPDLDGGRTRPSPTCTPSGRRCSTAGCCRLHAWCRCADRAATRPDSTRATASDCGWTRPATGSPWRGTTPSSVP